MFKVFWIFALVSSMTIAAEAVERFECNPDPDSPTYQLTRKDANTFALRAHFPNNGQTAPILSGDLSLFALSYIVSKADFVQAMGPTYEVDFPASQCIRQKHSENLFYIHCYKKTPLTLGNKSLNGISFHATAKTVTSLTWSSTGYVPITDEQIAIGVEVGTPTSFGTHWLDFSRTYNLSECRVTNGFWN